jgi:integrase/recombinase XerD
MAAGCRSGRSSSSSPTSSRPARHHTVEAYARDLRDLFEWLEQRGWDFRELNLEQLAEFFTWLRRPRPTRRPDVFVLPGTPSAVEQTTLVRKRSAVASFYRFHSRRDERVPALLGELDGPRPTGTYQPMLVHTRQRGPNTEPTARFGCGCTASARER